MPKQRREDCKPWCDRPDRRRRDSVYFDFFAWFGAVQMPCHWLGMAGLLLLKLGRLIKRRDVETNGILGVVKATFIPSRPVRRRLIRKRRGDATNSATNPTARSYPVRVLLIDRQIYVVIPHGRCSWSGRTVANDLAVLHDE